MQKDTINRPPALSEINTQDIARKAVIISPGFSAVAYDSTLGITDTYLAEIDTTHADTLADALQAINYGYHIRGQQNCINCRNKQAYIDKENDLFGMKLDFEEDKRYFDGNISRQTWKNARIGNQEYKHFYDGVSRLTKSAYSGGLSGSNYSLDTVRYDPSGNILQLKRHVIDNLSYTYNGNQLLKVADSGTNDGFKDGANTDDDYGYWTNGALKYDRNKGIDSIEYHSYLKKVSRVKFTNGNWINFFYDGAGTLLKRKLSNADEWVYQDEIIFKNNKYYQINHEEGRAVYDTLEQKWVHEFSYRDHQGNLRLSFRDSLAAPVNGVYAPPVITQIDERDPTGVSLSGLNYANENKNNFGFIDRETIAETGWIDLNNRFYMPDLMRFGQTDPITEGQENYSLYQYGYNNPVLNSDPNGDCPKCLKALAKTAIKSVIKGKVDLGEVYDVIDAGRTLLDPNASWLDKGIAVFDVVSPISTKEAKVVGKFLGVVDDAKDVKKAAKGGVYTLSDETGTVVRTGRTKDLKQREKQHKNAKDTKDLDFNEAHRTDDYAEQRGLEQKVYNDNPQAQSNNGGLNKIKPIRDKNEKKPIYEKAAEDYLKRKQ
jgi:RHS repeat-associated protein